MSRPTPPLGTPASPGVEVRVESLAGVADLRQRHGKALNWSCPFVLPAWLEAWWRHFAGEWRAEMRSVWHQGALAGIAPLMRRGREMRLIGDKEVCDHLDVVIDPSLGERFGGGLLDQLARDGVRRLVLAPVREDSAVVTHLLPAAERQGARVACDNEANLYRMPLPDAWQAYLDGLRGKERHEIRRKFRRLDEAGRVTLSCITDPAQVPAAMDRFLTLFRANRTDKAAFMSGAMPDFFRRLAGNLADAQLLRIVFLELDERTVAAVLLIVDGDTVYLYNNGYDAAFAHLSVGQLSKVMTIRESIRDGRRFYDFLKGAEGYKKRLGGRPVKVCRCVIDLV